VTKERFDSVTTHIGRVREIKAEVRANPRNEMKRLHEKMLSRGDQISREEFERIKNWYPLTRWMAIRTFFNAYSDLIEVYGKVRRRVGDFKKKDEANLRLYYERAWAVAHLTVLLGSDSASYLRQVLTAPECPKIMHFVAYQMMNSCLTSFTARGAWLVGQIGKPMLAPAKHAYQQAYDSLAVVDSGVSLMSLGLMHRKYRAEISKVLAQNSQAIDSDPTKKLVQAMRAVTAEYFDLECENPQDFEPLLPLFGASVMRDYGKLFAPGHVLAFGDNDPIDDGLACSFAMQMPLNLLGDNMEIFTGFLGWMPWVARASCTDFFLPEKYMDCMRGEWTPDHALTLLKPALDFEHPADQPIATPKDPPKPERNAPCPCGSQKKYKRCCALKPASERPVAMED
jgi:hypothetical protein